MTTAALVPSASPDVHAFDFIHGRWTIVNRRLKTRNAGAEDWDVFPSASTCEPRLGGVANVEEVACPARGWTGMALRALDLQTGLWSIWWLNSLDGQLQPPVRGGFDGGVGVFVGPDMDGDQPILARFIWSDITPHSARWTQAFSYDGGVTWETNWIMDFTRAES